MRKAPISISATWPPEGRLGSCLTNRIKTAGVRWNVASDIVVAWIVTLPAALFGAAFYELYKFLS